MTVIKFSLTRRNSTKNIWKKGRGQSINIISVLMKITSENERKVLFSMLNNLWKALCLSGHLTFEVDFL